MRVLAVSAGGNLCNESRKIRLKSNDNALVKMKWRKMFSAVPMQTKSVTRKREMTTNRDLG